MPTVRLHQDNLIAVANARLATSARSAHATVLLLERRMRVVVVAGGAVIWATGWMPIDPLLSLVVAFLNHLETTRAAADAGKHVFLDKPIANTVSDGRRITEICRKARVVLALGYQRRR